MEPFLYENLELFNWSKQLKESIHRKGNNYTKACYLDFKCGCHMVYQGTDGSSLWSFACKDHKYEIKDRVTFTKPFNKEENDG